MTPEQKARQEIDCQLDAAGWGVQDWDESKKKFKRADIMKRNKWMRFARYVPTRNGQRTEIRSKRTKLPSRRTGKGKSTSL